MSLGTSGPLYMSVQFREAPVNDVLLLTPVANPYPRDMDSFLHVKPLNNCPYKCKVYYILYGLPHPEECTVCVNETMRSMAVIAE